MTLTIHYFVYPLPPYPCRQANQSITASLSTPPPPSQKSSPRRWTTTYFAGTSCAASSSRKRRCIRSCGLARIGSLGGYRERGWSACSRIRCVEFSSFAFSLQSDEWGWLLTLVGIGRNGRMRRKRKWKSDCSNGKRRRNGS